MKPLLFLATFFLLQQHSLAQKFDLEAVFSDCIQIDSSNNYLIPKVIGSGGEDVYGKGKGYLPWNHFRQIYFYDATTGAVSKLFPNLAIINPIETNRSGYYNNFSSGNNDEQFRNFLPHHILFLARTENYSGDKALDNDDPIYLYLSTKSGDQLTQITPTGVHVLSWKLSYDKKMIIVKCIKDNNGNRKFGEGDQEVFYRIDLKQDISSIKCSPIIF